MLLKENYRHNQRKKQCMYVCMCMYLFLAFIYRRVYITVHMNNNNDISAQNTSNNYIYSWDFSCDCLSATMPSFTVNVIMNDIEVNCDDCQSTMNVSTSRESVLMQLRNVFFTLSEHIRGHNGDMINNRCQYSCFRSESPTVIT